MTVMEREKVRWRMRMNYNEIRISCLVKSMGKGKRVVSVEFVSTKDMKLKLLDIYHFADSFFSVVFCTKLNNRS